MLAVITYYCVGFTDHFWGAEPESESLETIEPFGDGDVVGEDADAG